jgi:hypothetical protein
MSLSKQEIAERLKDLGIQGSSDAGKLRRWVVESQDIICPRANCRVFDFNHYDADDMRAYVLRLVEKVEVEVFKPAWSFLWVASKKKLPSKIKIDRVLLTVQLGTTDEDIFSSTFPPIVTSESGLLVY